MGRLIDAGKLVNEIIRKYGNGEYGNGLADAIMEINAQPTVDPVTHGHWVHAYIQPYKCDKIEYYLCSECGRAVRSDEGDYCLFCGAKMDEEEK
jgi:hypothetical protein